jgi:ketosteroid isomerase-like protein
LRQDVSLLQSRPAAAVENATMENKQPIQIVLSFLDRINAHDVEGICSLLASDHIFVDGLGNKFSGIENLRKGWAGYFNWFPDYAISHEDVLGSGQIVLLTGSARGTYSVGGNLPTENHWEIPTAWKAVVRNDQIAEWHVFADNQPVRKIMGQINP